MMAKEMGRMEEERVEMAAEIEKWKRRATEVRALLEEKEKELERWQSRVGS